MRHLVEKHFIDYVKERFPKEEHCRFFLNHERKNLCIENLSRELQGIEYTTLTMDASLLRKVVRDFTEMFCQNAFRKFKKDNDSLSEIIRQQREQSEIEDLYNELEKDSETNVHTYNN